MRAAGEGAPLRPSSCLLARQHRLAGVPAAAVLVKLSVTQRVRCLPCPARRPGPLPATCSGSTPRAPAASPCRWCRPGRRRLGLAGAQGRDGEQDQGCCVPNVLHVGCAPCDSQSGYTIVGMGTAVAGRRVPLPPTRPSIQASPIPNTSNSTDVYIDAAAATVPRHPRGTATGWRLGCQRLAVTEKDAVPVWNSEQVLHG